MEKLQAALAKARMQRDESPAAAGLAPEGPRATGAAAWEALPRIELSDAVLRRHRVVSQEAMQESESFDVLRTKVLMQMRQNGWKRLAITSPGSQSGKSTTACNLALGLGRQSSVRTILFDFDLGSPSVHEFFGIESPHALSDVLNGDVAFDEHAVRVRDNVAVVVSPRIEADPTRLVLSDQMVAFLDLVQTTYKPDLMLFDLPAILSGDRARAFLKTTDCALIVAMADKTRFNHLDMCEREVAESTNVLGVVINGCHRRAMPQDEL